MVTERQVRRLMKELIRGEPLVRAAMRSGMSENTARRYREEPGRGRGREARGYRTRPDPFAEMLTPHGSPRSEKESVRCAGRRSAPPSCLS
jgi:hypothetical protein